MTLYNAAWIFLVYAFLGWCTEVVFQAAIRGKFINRGFLNGPVCPIYGFGVLAVIGCLTPLKDNLAVLFFGSVVLTTVLEFITGFVLEKFFCDKWWDYSNEPFNIKGYVCLRFSLAWGIACVIVVDIIHPIIMKGISLIPHVLGIVLACVFTAMMAADAVVSILAAVKMKKRLVLMEELSEKLHDASDKLGTVLADNTLEVKGKAEVVIEKAEVMRGKAGAAKQELEETLDKYRELARSTPAIQRRLLRSFPNLKTGRYGRSVQRLDLLWRAEKSVAARRRPSRAASMRTGSESVSLRGYRDILSAITDRLDAQRLGTEGHSERVSEMVSRLCSLAETRAHIAVVAETAAALHDIGYALLDTAPLMRESELTPEEQRSLMAHPALGAEILRAAGCPEPVCANVENHHEHWDGTGYPKGISGDDIPIGARMILLCGAADAMLSGRSYMPARDAERCKEKLRQQSGKAFDPDLTELMLSNWDYIIG